LGQDADFRWREGDERVGKYLKGLVIQRFWQTCECYLAGTLLY
jgi:hypothetical protein